MFNKKIVGLVMAQALLVAPLWANAKKDCIKAANTQFKSDMANCKDLKGADKKACKKTAKENRDKAKAACSNPAPQ